MSHGPRWSTYSDATIAAGNTNTIATGGYITGKIIVAARSVVISGLQFYWQGGKGALTVRCQLWDGTTSTSLQSVDVAVNAAGIYYATFPGSVTLKCGAFYRISTWETSSSWYSYFSSDNVSYGTSAWMIKTDMDKRFHPPGLFIYGDCYATGAACPTHLDANNFFNMTPRVRS